MISTTGSPRCRGGPPASRHQHHAAARFSGRVESPVRGAWVESATIAHAQTPLPPPPRSGSRCPERRLRLVRAIARGRRWLDEIVSSSVTDAEQIALRERCTVRQVNMTISLAFLAPTSALRSRGVCLGAHRTAARCSCRMETALRSAWVESATIAHVSKTPLLPRHRLLCPIWRRESPPKYQLNICFVSVPGCRLNYIHFSIHRKLKSARGR